jgi:hypothetical protein
MASQQKKKVQIEKRNDAPQYAQFQMGRLLLSVAVLVVLFLGVWLYQHH